ncbi:RagB/SusD family nutrient uptake outer membrane protein [Fulvivirga maritima]|uniref:RagB/SusD family nutrient uptake outer membrane protein n=1 Tax=Fulvivirga maritima TaxID=2904247 RepID=UPI001F1B5002|nr:RagB/SusD family nutrient uptake outer membrane protein [Fulvivirga maritima]UII26392.1 RagB/SusD family nutrient uptake outer membrane protein [Fulvivirga maritima]
MKRIIYSLAFVATLILSGCRDYVEVEDPTQRELKYTEDYQYLLNYTTRLETACQAPLVASDDIELEGESIQNSVTEVVGAIYRWADNIYPEGQQDNDWQMLYQQLYTINSVTDGVMASEGGTNEEKQDLLAQAKVHRAFAYFSLVNMYGKQYNVSTAASDLGVPMLTKPDLFASLERASVQEVYDQIIKDLEEALVVLPDFQENSFLPGRAGALALKARVYLQMGDYDSALAYANEALALQNTLNNLAEYEAAPTTYPVKYSDPEIMLSKSFYASLSAVPVNDELLDLFEEGDLRYELFTAPASNFYWEFEGRGYWKPSLVYQGIYVGPSVPEMMLIKAECLARNDNDQEAIDALNELRVARFAPEDYEPFTIEGSVIRKVLDERRRELFCTGIRWFDLKRLNQEPQFATTIEREFLGENYVLEPNSNEYVFQIAPIYRRQNPEIESNPR